MPRKKMTLPTGIKPARRTHKLFDNLGLTFVEVMVTLVILSSGITMVFKSFIVSLDQLRHLTNRLYATTILDNRIAYVERMLRAYKVLPMETDSAQKVDVGVKEVKFKSEMSISAVEEYVDIFRLDVSLQWQEGNKNLRMSRSAFISNFDPIY